MKKSGQLFNYVLNVELSLFLNVKDSKDAVKKNAKSWLVTETAATISAALSINPGDTIAWAKPQPTEKEVLATMFAQHDSNATVWKLPPSHVIGDGDGVGISIYTDSSQEEPHE
jgi:hypothetical protein